MRNRTFIITIVAAILVAAPALTVAQGFPGGPGDGQGRFGGRHGSVRGEDGSGMLRMLPRLAERLELSDEQQTQLQAILDESLPEIEALVEESRTARNDFRATHTIGDFDEVAYRIFFEDQAKKKVEIQLLTSSTVAKVYNDVLSPEQQEEFDQYCQRAGESMHRRSGGRRSK